MLNEIDFPSQQSQTHLPIYNKSPGQTLDQGLGESDRFRMSHDHDFTAGH
jgi:hypothetical protein